MSDLSTALKTLTSSDWIASAAFVVSLISALIAWRVGVRTKSESIFSLRREVLLKAREIEIEWQELVSEVQHQKILQRGLVGNSARRHVGIEYLEQLDTAFSGSLENTRAMRVGLQGEFEKLAEIDARKYIVTFEGEHLSLQATRKEMAVKLARLNTTVSKPVKAVGPSNE
jgi:hypothetical protein